MVNNKSPASHKSIDKKEFKIRKIRSVSKGGSEVFFSERKALSRADSYSRIE